GSYAKNPGISVDASDKKLNIDLASQNIMMADDATTNFVKTYGGTVYIPLAEIDGSLYFPLNTTDQFFKLRYTVRDDAIWLRGYATDKTGAKTDLANIDFYAPKKIKWTGGSEKLCLAWDYTGAVPHPAPQTKYGGLDVISPTWFHLITDGDGSVENYGDKVYADSAHSSGYMVWATITNNMSTKGSTAFTTKTFSDSELLNRSVAQYIFYSCLYDADGINIDYEDVSDGDAAGLTAFTALMRNYTERQGLVLSIDVMIPAPWTAEYDRASLSDYVDYLAVMTYDEHYGGSPDAGSVASLPWVEEAIKATLKEVPPSKLLLGVPLYTRIWTVDSAGNVVSNPAA
ncbi:MAG TPA: glycosyl hydrolase family 18 protein, partial [Bacillota bacterium]|nr:glycosyl hydrolase family 18 protein [Bacillota bacterium]